MTKNSIFIGEKEAQFNEHEIEGKLVDFENEKYYKISNHDAMRPFFMSIVSDSNHWMFISSNGGLSAGRKDSGFALFPYYTDDKITESADITGSKTILKIQSEGKTHLWEPFSDRYLGMYSITRNLYKHSFGNKVVFEEINQDLDLTFRYQWCSSDQFGFVKKATLLHNAEKELKITVLDGIQNIMPFGVDTSLQAMSSNLVDAYKKNELESDIGLGIYALSAIIVDKAEPSEALKASTVWSLGIENPTYLVSSLQLDDFRRGKHVEQEEDIRAEKGAYFVVADLSLPASSKKEWMIVADVNQSIVDITSISHKLKDTKNLKALVQKDIERGTKHLLELNAAADGLQMTADKLRNTRHFANTLFNIMRGGIFDDNYNIEGTDFVRYIKKANLQVVEKKQQLLKQLPETFTLDFLRDLIEGAQDETDKDFKRLCLEYLPLKFSRRHGDPSRPWNKFSINTKNEDGSKILDYQGNWRDIFQNWEALAHSYPEFMEGMIHKFLNATTFDGYNPYRVTKDGFDWETIEPDDPWSYIGYWGDHQIIYLLKFLEFIEKHTPSTLSRYFNDDIFVYANVPYKIKSYTEILKNSKDTIELDREAEEHIIKRRKELGADGGLLQDAQANIYKVNLIEKLLTTVLAKMSNFIIEGGIWMNTQRPEWNDANNALVGNGVSMVTLYYLRRFLSFFEKIIQSSAFETSQVSEELAIFFGTIFKTLKDNQQILSRKVSDTDRKTVLDGLGNAASDYRKAIYEKGFQGNKAQISKIEIDDFLKVSICYLEHSIAANKRADRLYHSYNLMTVESDSEVSIAYLPEMLEGQVAVLSSGYISSKETVELLDALKSSALFREDQYSYILYPNKQLSRFTEKNTIPSNIAGKSELIEELLENNNAAIVQKDVNGGYHFNGTFNNADSLKKALLQLPKEKYGALVEKDATTLLAAFETVFNHKSFTGRSGTFYGYEGLGSIYWHMVSKLVLSVQENCLKAINGNESDLIIGRLFDHYYEMNEGIGVHKSPELYGAFPTDPYSHTPGGKGAQQPGMTGQVKEDILSRFGELGVFVSEGCLVFNPSMLRKEEFLKKTTTFQYFSVTGNQEQIELKEGTLAFTYCQIPIVYELGNTSGLRIKSCNQEVYETDHLRLDQNTSRKIFKRTGEIDSITVYVIK
jgi:hypothetical protein